MSKARWNFIVFGALGLAATCFGGGARAEENLRVETLIENMAKLENTVVSADMTSKIHQRATADRGEIFQTCNYAILRGGGRFRAVGSDTLTGVKQESAQGFLPGQVFEIWSESPFPGGNGVGTSGYGTIYRGERVGDTYLSIGRDGNWLFGCDFFLKDSDLPKRLAEADAGRLAVEVEPDRKVLLTAKLSVGDYRLTFDPQVGMNLVRMRIERALDRHLGLPEDFPYRELTFDGEIAYTEAGARHVPASGTARMTAVLGNTGATKSTAFAISLSNIQLPGDRADTEFRIDWPANSVAYDVEAGTNMVTNSRGEFVRLREDGTTDESGGFPAPGNYWLLYGVLAVAGIGAAVALRSAIGRREA